MTFKEKMQEWREELAVKWFMLDAQQKQAALIICITLFQASVNVITSRLSGGKNAGEK